MVTISKRTIPSNYYDNKTFVLCIYRKNTYIYNDKLNGIKYIIQILQLVWKHL